MTSTTVSTHEAIRRLEDGNARFVAGLRSVESLASARRLAELARNGQRPYAAFLACADSRVPTETIFDCGLGDLFVTRLAGNVVTPHILASLEYGAMNLGTSLVVVLGHTGCGAVRAAIDHTDENMAELTNSLQVLVKDLGPAVAEARTMAPGSPEALTKAVERENVRLGCQAILQRSETLAAMSKNMRVHVVGALFDMETGRVEFGLETPMR